MCNIENNHYMDHTRQTIIQPSEVTLCKAKLNQAFKNAENLFHLVWFGQIDSDTNTFSYNLQGRLFVDNYISKFYEIYMVRLKYQPLQTIALLLWQML